MTATGWPFGQSTGVLPLVPTIGIANSGSAGSVLTGVDGPVTTGGETTTPGQQTPASGPVAATGGFKAPG